MPISLLCSILFRSFSYHHAICIAFLLLYFTLLLQIASMIILLSLFACIITLFSLHLLRDLIFTTVIIIFTPVDPLLMKSPHFSFYCYYYFFAIQTSRLHLWCLFSTSVTLSTAVTLSRLISWCLQRVGCMTSWILTQVSLKIIRWIHRRALWTSSQ